MHPPAVSRQPGQLADRDTMRRLMREKFPLTTDQANAALEKHHLGRVKSLAPLPANLLNSAFELERADGEPLILKVNHARKSEWTLANDRRVVELLRAESAVPVASLCLFDGDRALLTQMLANLVENAIRHGREGGTTTVRLARAGPDRVELLVVDDGPGIPVAERDLVFRRFHRLDQARSTPGSGRHRIARVAKLRRADRIERRLGRLCPRAGPAEPARHTRAAAAGQTGTHRG